MTRLMKAGRRFRDQEKKGDHFEVVLRSTGGCVMGILPGGYGLGKAALFAAGILFLGSLSMLREGAEPRNGPVLITVSAGEVILRPMGNFSKEGKAADAPVSRAQLASFKMMKYQVTQLQYSLCVDAGVCVPAPTVQAADSAQHPQTNVSWRDATRYAAWYSEQTGQSWRLPSVEEWHRAAAERYNAQIDDAGGIEVDLDPGARMLAQYADGNAARGKALSGLRPIGAFGENALGFADMAGNVWEWTDGCFANGVVREDGSVERSADYCGVRIAAGAHRVAVINFVRDASVGGCAVGLPPDHLGFRLVRSR